MLKKKTEELVYVFYSMMTQMKMHEEAKEILTSIFDEGDIPCIDKLIREEHKTQDQQKTRWLVRNIVWDTDGIPAINLPKIVYIDKEMEREELEDYLSDTYGWLVKCFEAQPV